MDTPESSREMTLNELNKLLKKGWQVIKTTSLGDNKTEYLLSKPLLKMRNGDVMDWLTKPGWHEE